MVINKMLEEMRLNIRTHRRNKAVQQFDQCLRMSYAPAQTHVSPLSLRNSFQPCQSYRNSDLSCLSKRASISKKQQIIFRNIMHEQVQSKNTSALMSSLNFLQTKLLDAKNLLQKQSSHKLNPKSTSLFMSQNLSQVPKDVIGSKKQDINEESTLNLESRKLLKNNLNCKEKIVWANSLKQYYIGPVVRGMAGINDRAYEHLYESHQLMMQHQSFVPPKIFSPINLTCHPVDKFKKVLVIDMDQTLIHCQSQYTSKCQIEVEIDDGERGYISIRPYALSFLKKMSKYYQIIVFTASQKDYADSILNEIDPEGLIKHRLYRQHCLKINKNVYSKDLRIINRDLSQIILVDNSAISFLCQPQNGVPILPYMGGEDRQLLQLEKYLDLLTKEDDVRKLNNKMFKLERYREYQSCEELAAELYEDPKSYY